MHILKSVSLPVITFFKSTFFEEIKVILLKLQLTPKIHLIIKICLKIVLIMFKIHQTSMILFKCGENLANIEIVLITYITRY